MAVIRSLHSSSPKPLAKKPAANRAVMSSPSGKAESGSEVRADSVQLGQSRNASALSPVPKVQAQKTSDKPRTAAVEPASVEPADEETTNWVLESAASTPYANDPSMAIVKKRYGTLTEAVRCHLTEPLLDALTTSDIEQGRGKLKEVADTANWAQKFKKDAARQAADGGYRAMSKEAAAFYASQNGADEATPLDGVLKSKTLRFSSDLPQHRLKEANQLLEQYHNGNENPGIGSKALGKGISYLRGRKGTRIFYKKQGDDTQWLAVCDKSTEPKAIKLLQKEFQLS